MEYQRPKMLIPTLLLLAIQAADDEVEYDIRDRLRELYDAYTKPPFIITSGAPPQIDIKKENINRD